MTIPANEITEEKIEPRHRGIYLLPNLFTVSALFAGFYGIIAGLKGFYDQASIAIFIAMLLDSLDGRVARLTNTVTAFGAEFDSLADMVCFGVAPALIAYNWSLFALGKIGWLAAFIYVAAVALRLARFNTQLASSDKRYFKGIPCTAAAPVLVGFVWIGGEFALSGFYLSFVTALLAVALGFLMVSNIRYRSFKDFDLKKNVPFVVVLAIVLVVVFVSIDPPKVLFAIFTLYAILGPVETIFGLRKRRRERIVAKKA